MDSQVPRKGKLRELPPCRGDNPDPGLGGFGLCLKSGFCPIPGSGTRLVRCGVRSEMPGQTRKRAHARTKQAIWRSWAELGNLIVQPDYSYFAHDETRLYTYTLSDAFPCFALLPIPWMDTIHQEAYCLHAASSLLAAVDGPIPASRPSGSHLWKGKA